MAYNILKGVVEGSVDQHADQEISGIKIFKNTISASVFYDTDAQSACATMKDVAISRIKGGSKDSILICDIETGARSHHDFTYDGKTLSVKVLSAGILQGDAGQLHNIPSDKFVGQISAADIKYGHGLQNIRGQLQLNIGDGLRFDGEKLQASVGMKSGLCHVDGKLIIDPAKTEPINSRGQNLADNDILIVADVSKGAAKGTTLANLYQNYLTHRIPHAVGNKNQIQLKGDSEFASSPKLTFDSASDLLNVEGKVRANTAHVEGSLICGGAVRHNITKTAEKIYKVKPSDYTILCDTEKNKITVSLPPACNNTGRVLIVKKVDTNKYKITSNIVELTCEEGRIDINNRMQIKMNYSSRTVQSDGENWWLIGNKGT